MKKLYIFTIFVFLFCYGIVWFKLRNSEMTNEILSHAARLSFVNDNIGSQLSLGFSDSYQLKKGKDKSSYLIRLPVSGEKGEGDIQVKSEERDGAQVISSLHLFTNDQCFVFRPLKGESVCKEKRTRRQLRGEKHLYVF